MTATRRAIVQLTMLTMLCPLAAVAGEATSLYATGRWQAGQKAAAGSKLVVVAKVTEVGKPTGKGWDGNFLRDSVNYQSWTGEVQIEQQVVVEVVEVLRGRFTGKKLSVKLGTARLNYRGLQSHWSRHFRKRGKGIVQPSLPVSVFALRKGHSYLLFLPTPKSGKKSEPPAAAHLGAYAPAESGDKTTLKSVRAFCAALAVWENPPKLSAEQAADAKKMIAQLGDEVYDRRAAADKALRAVAPRIAPQLIAAAKDKDIERAMAVRKIIEDFRPKPGKTEHPKVEKPPEKPKPAPAKKPGKPDPAPSDG